MSDQRLTTIVRKARIWPEMPETSVTVPSPPNVPTTGNPFILISMSCSLLGMLLYALIMPHLTGVNGYFTFGFLIISGCVALGTLLTFLIQWIPSRRRRLAAWKFYRQQLESIRKQLEDLERRERQGRILLDPPFLMRSSISVPGYENIKVTPIIKRSCDNHDMCLWARRPANPDFLSVRIGMSFMTPKFTVERSQISPLSSFLYASRYSDLIEEAQRLSKDYMQIVAPFTIKLNECSTVTLLGADQRLSQARHLACAIIAALAYHHSPEDVRIIVLAPERQRNTWDWTAMLPHTFLYEAREPDDPESELYTDHAVAIGNEAVLYHLPWISRELSRRELLLNDIPAVQQSKVKPMLPHLLIIVDHFDEIDDLDPVTQHVPVPNSLFSTRQQRTTVLKRPRLTISPLLRPEMTLALNASQPLGVSVLAICGNQASIPPATGLLIDITDAPSMNSAQASMQALIHRLDQHDQPVRICRWLDEVPREALSQFAMRIQSLRPTITKQLELRTQVDLCSLYEPVLDLSNYDPVVYWSDPTLRNSEGLPLMRVPIGLKIGDETQYLDFIKDGPHGLLIGQTGSGKSELLQTIIAALAVAYRPDEVNFLLIDYKAGLALEPFSRLPHTIGFLSNVSSSALIQRFITMLRAEATRRELRMKEGKATPRLVIIIDEFAEMVKRTENVLDELFTITRVGREIGMHLLLSTQRPDGIIGSKVRDYVQYRLCLRCASPEDSREVLRRVDAASLPASIPGRCYLLHGDNQLDLFQAARVTIPIASTMQRVFTLPIR